MDLISKTNRSSLGWQKNHLKIVNKEGVTVPLDHNIAQLKVYNTKYEQIKRGLPVRVIVLKARQEGVSTGEAGTMFESINRRPNRFCCLISADMDSTNKVFRMIRRFQSEMPAHVRMKPFYSSRKEIEFPEPHYSSILCQTAGKDVLGRGGTTHELHVTELAFWAHAGEQCYGLFQEVPKTGDTSICIESTAFGTTGEFHDRFKIATKFVRDQFNLHGEVRDFNGFLPIFLAWHIFPSYQMVIPEHYRMEPSEDHEVYGNEIELFRKYGCSPEQLYWRRWVIQNDFRNDLARFKQEYPATAKEAFQGTGRMVFLPSALDELEKRVTKPIEHIEFYLKDKDKPNEVSYRTVNKRENCWAVWKYPESNHSYIVYGDVAEGLLSDPSNKRSLPDRSVAGVLDRNRFSMPMVYYGRPDTVEYADQMLMAAKFFNWAWASPEMNSIGQAVLDTFKRDEYPYIYQREYKEDQDATEDAPQLGLKVTVANRKPMISDLEQVTKENEIIIKDHRIIDEMRDFVYGKDGKPQANVGCFDDCVMMMAGLIRLHQRCPMDEDDYSWMNEQKKQRPEVDVMGEVDDDDIELDGERQENELMYEDLEDYS